MAVIVYQCDTCRRTCELVENPYGLEVFGTCTITQDCCGHMTRISRKGDYDVGHQISTEVDGLTDWLPKRQLVTYTVSQKSTKWRVVHNLNSEPTIQVMVKNSAGVLVTTDAYTVSSNTPTTTEVVFATAKSGVIQLRARTSISESALAISQDNQQAATPSQLSDTAITVNGIAVLAFAQQFADQFVLACKFMVTENQQATEVVRTIVVPPKSEASPSWSGVPRVFCNGNAMQVTAVDLSAVLATVPTLTPIQFGTINNGSFVPFESSVYLLLSNSPYTSSYDRNLTQYINVTSNAYVGVTEIGGISVYQTYVKSVYPYIKVV